MPVEIPVYRLSRHCNPFTGAPWGVQITRQAVRKALKDGRLVDSPGTNDHAGRIAYLVINEAADPIDIDVGVPILGCYVRWFVVDGNHRLAAAMMAGRSTVKAIVRGQMDYAKRLFGVNCEE